MIADAWQKTVNGHVIEFHTQPTNQPYQPRNITAIWPLSNYIVKWEKRATKLMGNSM